MTEKIKNYVGISAAASMIIVALAGLQFVGAYSRNVEPTSFRSFNVSGNGKAVGVPDIAEFTFGIVTEGGVDIAALQKENIDKANRVIDFVKANGVDLKDIRTENYNLTPRYQYSNCGSVIYSDSSISSGAVSPRPCPPPEIVGYSINQSVSVKVRDFTKTGLLLSGVIKNGANTVSQLTFRIDDPTEVQNEARAEAIQKAKAKAEAIAQAGGFRLGRLLSIQESGYFPPTPFYSRELGLTSDSSAEKIQTIEPGSEDVSITVTLTYEIR